MDSFHNLFAVVVDKTTFILSLCFSIKDGICVVKDGLNKLMTLIRAKLEDFNNSKDV